MGTDANNRRLALPPEAMLKQVLATMPAGLFTLDLKGNITSWNPEMEAITGYSSSEVVGQPCSMLKGDTCFRGPCGAGNDRCPLFSEGEIQGRRCRVYRRDGTPVTVLKNARLLRDANGKLVGAIEAVTDISGTLKLEQELAELREEASGRTRFRRLVGRHRSMQQLYDRIELAARSQSSVLIQGETGTGKELVAHAIHHSSPRSDGPFVRTSCAALSESLLESELFGHVRGAFTGAVTDRVGRFEAADGGTIFLDEIGTISAAVQAKLLRVLQEREFERVGDSRPVRVNIRIIAATNHDLRVLCDRGRFRDDLYFRLAVVPIDIPPLRERRTDIPPLVDHFLQTLGRTLGRKPPAIAPAAMKRLLAYGWPGNVRELQHAIEYAFVLSKGELISHHALPPHIGGDTPRAKGSRPDSERIERALREAGGNRTRAAQMLGVSRVTLWKWLRSLEAEGVGG